MNQKIEDKELKIFIDRVKNLSNYNFSDYSDKSLKRRLAKILFDNDLDFQSFLDRIEKSKYGMLSAMKSFLYSKILNN